MSFNLNCKQIVDQVRTSLDEAGVSSAKWSDTEVVRAINRAKDYYVNQINKSHPEILLKKGDPITIVDGTELYNLPGDFKAMRRVETASKEKLELIPMDYKEQARGTNDYDDAALRRRAYYMLGNQIGVLNYTGDITPYYLRKVPDLHYGTVEAVTDTTMTFDSTPNASSSGDYTVRRNDDYYNNLTVEIFSGTGAGQERVISDYVGLTKIATVANWTTNPDTSSLYALKYDLPVEVDDLIILRTALRLIPKERAKSATEIRNQMLESEREFLTNLTPTRERKYVEYVPI